MKITTKSKAIFEFTPEEYYLVNDKDPWAEGQRLWSLNYRIDRSEKGKDDDIGMPRIYVDETEAKELFKQGFSKIEL